MEFFIKHRATLPKIRLGVYQDGRSDYLRRLPDLLENTVLFSMVDVETSQPKVVNKPCTVVPISYSGITTGYEISFQFSNLNTNKIGKYEAYLSIQTIDGIIGFPLTEKLFIYVIDSFSLDDITYDNKYEIPFVCCVKEYIPPPSSTPTTTPTVTPTTTVTPTQTPTTSVTPTVTPTFDTTPTVTPSTSNPNPLIYKALKVGDFETIVGNSSAEDDLIKYAQCLGFNIIQMYDLYTIFDSPGLSASLDGFLTKLYNVGLLPVAILGSGNAGFDLAYAWEQTPGRVNTFWGVNKENEFWWYGTPFGPESETFTDWINSMNYVRETYPHWHRSAYVANPMYGTPTGWTQTEANQIVAAGINIIEATNYNSGAPDPSWASFLNGQLELFANAAASSGITQSFVPLWSSDAVDSGPYFGLTPPDLQTPLANYDASYAALSFTNKSSLIKYEYSIFMYSLLTTYLPECLTITNTPSTTPTLTPTPTITATNTQTPTLTPSPLYYYYNLLDCNFSNNKIGRSVIGGLTGVYNVDVDKCYTIVGIEFGDYYDYDLDASTLVSDCEDSSCVPTPTLTSTITETPTPTVTTTVTPTITPSVTTSNTPTITPTETSSPTPTPSNVTGSLFEMVLFESGSDVVMSGTGKFNTTDLTFTTNGNFNAVIRASLANFISGPSTLVSTALYSGVTSPNNFGTGGQFLANSGSGDRVGILFLGPGDYRLAVPVGYVSNTTLTTQSTYTGKTLSSLGVVTGTYNYTWGSGANTGTLKLQIG